MKKRYIGISAIKEPRAKGKHAKPISVPEVAKISYTENLSVDEYNTQLCDGFNAWLLQAYSNRPKGCNPIWQEDVKDAAKTPVTTNASKKGGSNGQLKTN